MRAKKESPQTCDLTNQNWEDKQRLGFESVNLI